MRRFRCSFAYFNCVHFYSSLRWNIQKLIVKSCIRHSGIGCEVPREFHFAFWAVRPQVSLVDIYFTVARICTTQKIPSNKTWAISRASIHGGELFTIENCNSFFFAISWHKKCNSSVSLVDSTPKKNVTQCHREAFRKLIN